MRRFILLTALIASAGAHGRSACAELIKLQLLDISIEHATSVAAPVAHCKATGKIGGKIGFSIWLPEQWNGRFAMGGAGGFVGPEDNQALRFTPNLLERGFATASTDTGHVGAPDGTWALNDYEAIVNYGHLAMHRAVVAAKAVIASHYANPIDKSFFIGCSNGGRQALHEAQRYPHDFDAIVAGAPALNFGGVTAAFVSITQKMFPDPSNLNAALVTPEDRKLLRRAILERCDLRDGLADGYLHDPTACDFNPSSLVCELASDTTGDCLSSAKVDAINTVYRGPYAGNQQLFFGFPFGAENLDANGWGSWLTGGSTNAVPNAAYMFGVGIMRYFVHHDPEWSYAGYDWNNFEGELFSVEQVLNATNPDLAAFREQGGKLLLFHGWADVALTAHMSTDYVDRVYAQDPRAAEDVRLFMMPGVLHCAGGPGPSVVNWLDILEQWHDTGDAPVALAAGYPDKPGARKLCAYPAKPVYAGGDEETEASYECR